MRYLLDTNAVIALQNRRQSSVARRILRHEIDDIGIPAIVIHEIYFGAFRSERRDRNALLIAGQARARQLTLVTRNTAEFARVPYLRIEDWARR